MATINKNITPVNFKVFILSLNQSSFASKFVTIESYKQNGDITIELTSGLTAPEEADLDAIILAHDPVETTTPNGIINTFSGTFDGLSDLLLLDFEKDGAYAQIRWNAAEDQCQFRVRGNMGWVDGGIKLVRGNSSNQRSIAQDYINQTTDAWSSWLYFDQGTTVKTNLYNLGLYGANVEYWLHDEFAGDPKELPFISLFIKKGWVNKMAYKIEIIE